MTVMMNLRWRIGLLALVVIGLANGVPSLAQGVWNGRYYGHTAVRLWQNYELRAGDEARDVFVLGGAATIDGEINGDAQVVLGDVHLGGTAVIHGTLVVTGGDIWIADGAIVRGDLGVIGGVIHAPANFSPGGSHFVFGAESFGRTLRAIEPWFFRGLLWGRLIVPSIGWVWAVVFTTLIVTLALNLLLHQPVGACASTMSARPVSAFMTGLLVLLLAGPLSAIMAASIVGIALIPFFLCALIVAWIVGKVGVSRWIGNTILPSEPDSRLGAMRAVLIGFAALCLIYMVPVLGLVTWAMIGVFGLGSATLAFLAALRRERPARPAKAAVPPPVPPSASAFEPAPAYAAPVYEEPLPPPPPPPPPPPYAAAPAPAPAVDLRGFPHAHFADRLAAAALDAVLLVLFIRSVRFGYGADDARMLFTLLYFVVFWAWKGTTLGGIICNLRLTRIDGAPLRFSDALVRGLAGIFSMAALGLGFLWILRDPERQAWHDRIAGTFVVKVPRDWPLP